MEIKTEPELTFPSQIDRRRKLPSQIYFDNRKRIEFLRSWLDCSYVKTDARTRKSWTREAQQLSLEQKLLSQTDPLLRMSYVLEIGYDKDKVEKDPDQGILREVTWQLNGAHRALQKRWECFRKNGWDPSPELAKTFHGNINLLGRDTYYNYKGCSTTPGPDDYMANFKRDAARWQLCLGSESRTAAAIATYGLNLFREQIGNLDEEARNKFLRKIVFSSVSPIFNPLAYHSITAVMRREVKIYDDGGSCGDPRTYDAEYTELAIRNRVPASFSKKSLNEYWLSIWQQKKVDLTIDGDRVIVYLDQLREAGELDAVDHLLPRGIFPGGYKNRVAVPSETLSFNILSNLGYLQEGEAIDDRREQIGPKLTSKDYRYNPSTREYASEVGDDGKYRLRLASLDPLLEGVWAFVYQGGLPDRAWGYHSQLPWAPLEVVFKYANSTQGMNAMMRSVGDRI